MDFGPLITEQIRALDDCKPQESERYARNTKPQHMPAHQTVVRGRVNREYRAWWYHRLHLSHWDSEAPVDVYIKEEGRGSEAPAFSRLYQER
jgi:hypothetical protein